MTDERVSPEITERDWGTIRAALLQARVHAAQMADDKTAPKLIRDSYDRDRQEFTELYDRIAVDE